ncbi:MAG TPA: glutamate synthase large subunit, partial [Longimicrobiaceae bacterium]|nr:glutamate synthase large subunit [Longimicrobiaceae bacterium]
MSFPLYDPQFEHDACGVGFVARVSGIPEAGIVSMALQALASLAHRGGVAADGKSGDGAGLLTQIPRRLFAQEAAHLGVPTSRRELLGVGMVFLPAGADSEMRRLEWALEAQELRVLGWRSVPIEVEALGVSARATLPDILQILVAPPGLEADAFEQRLYLGRRAWEREAEAGYLCSLSCRTLVYKALCGGTELGHFYPDLRDPLYESALAVFHQRFSTNTLPSWTLAQPFRLLAHNGEINTLGSNRAWMRAREPQLPEGVRPVLREDGSDSSNLDQALELLVRGGRSVEHALSMLVTSAWEETGDAVSPELRDFYRYHAPLLEPWDGPAGLAFSDGRRVGAALDRNGLRPCRFKITEDGLVVAGSEAGVLGLDDERVVLKDRLGPGQMLLVDVEAGRVLDNAQLKVRLVAARPYRSWITAVELPASNAAESAEPVPTAELPTLQRLFGFSREELNLVIARMAADGKEPIWSMGDDAPLAALSRVPRPVYDFLHQRFAQVTNPAIDPLREARVMSLRSWLGPRGALLEEGAHPPLLELRSPVLSAAGLEALRRQEVVPMAELACIFDPDHEPLPAALERICVEAEAVVRNGVGLLLLSDRAARADAAPIPLALCVGAVHHHLIRSGLRTGADLVVEAGDCWSAHHLAVLIGYGAGAVFPWLAPATARELEGGEGEVKLIAALEAGVLKIMSKMGISTVSSYRGGQIFEVLGLAEEVVERCFRGTASRIGGLSFAALQEAVVARHRAAFAPDVSEEDLPDYGLFRYRRAPSEYHAWEPQRVRALQRSVGSARGKDAGTPDPAAWEEFRGGSAPPVPRALRDLLDFVSGESIPRERVEPAEAIATRFVSSAMSLGALSPEAHRTLTLAMNRLGARSNSGEGGEDPDTYLVAEEEERQDSKIKQVASGRFGVTAAYLARAEEIEIKIAQGSKPGEGGQLPSHKVTELIARLRHVQPGVSLISPPPHHDIYSIEDLAQLIHDLKQCNPRARVGVKLVAEAGVGTIAAGVAKAYADYILIAGHAGGTGASPLSSIKHAGVPWELGLAETQQVLVMNGLRHRVRLRTDGGLMTGRDVMMAGLLGAEDFGFGTASVVAIGCDMARQCHLDSCPTGIASQRPELRAKFRGQPEQVMRYFLQIAEEVRQILATLGFDRLDDAVGRSDLLRQTRFPAGLELSRLLARAEGDSPRCTWERNDRPVEKDAELTLRSSDPGSSQPIRTRNRSVGARLSGELALRSPLDESLPERTELFFVGSAGQSFGAFCSADLRLVLTGEANDYVGKGLSGGELVLRPAGAARWASHRNVILGNVALYGATAGRLFAAGRAGERFAVRNSGATAVVEGLGDHGCEYMT